MKQKLHTILLQEEKIDGLTKRNRELERGYLSIARENKKLRAQIDRLMRRENGLGVVNI